MPVANQVVALQEYGQTNPSLIAGLEARGAGVLRVQVYRWDLPEDIGPLAQNVRDLAEGRLDVLLFTSAQQVVNLLRVADDLGLADRVRQRLAETVVASVGPTTSEVLRDRDLAGGRRARASQDGAVGRWRRPTQCQELLTRKKRISVAVSAVAVRVLAARSPGRLVRQPVHESLPPRAVSSSRPSG